MGIEKMREEFEEWASNHEIRCAWDVWKASRESLVIELPESYMDGLCESMEADDVRKAIHAAGVKTNG